MPAFLFYCHYYLREIIKKEVIVFTFWVFCFSVFSEYPFLFCFSPSQGYYVRNNMLGPEGDFITSPEISQIFGEVRLEKHLKLSVSFYMMFPLSRPLVYTVHIR